MKKLDGSCVERFQIIEHLRFNAGMRSEFFCLKSIKCLKSFCLFHIAVLTSFLLCAQSTPRKPIIVLSSNFYMTTFASIPCENFGTTFKTRVRTKQVRSKDTIERLDKFLDTIKISKENWSMNTRGKFLFVNKSGKQVTICIDLVRIKVDGNLIEPNAEFMRFLRSMIPKEQFVP
ncbi:MAG: hypothetical protein JST75_09320 [Bacteroidetes bacterium]|nr:hypothetical protein [Bacteroidota bacterium]